MKTLAFWKMSGAGNDFVLIDEAQAPRRPLPVLAALLCDRRRGVGADGLLVVSKKRRAVRYWNADGSAAFCGNGTRCAAAWLREHGGAKAAQFELGTDAGRVKARPAGRGRMAIRMPEPGPVSGPAEVTAAGARFRVYTVDTGVPHAVVFVDDAEAVDVVGAGRALRRHAAFAPAGANVDFVERRGRRLVLRTYERGVEDETLACGTGAVASALVAAAAGRAKAPVELLVRGGATLTARFSGEGGRFSDVWLEGPAETVFRGEIAL